MKESSFVDGPGFFFFQFSWSSFQLDLDAFDKAFDTVYQFQLGLTEFTGDQPTTQPSHLRHIYPHGD